MCCVSHIICVCICSYCIYVQPIYWTCTYSCTHAFMYASCMWGCTHKVLICASRHKANPPPIPCFLFPGGKISQSVYLAAPSRRGAGVRDGRLWRWWGGDSLAMFTGWMCRLGVCRRVQSLLAFLCLFSPDMACSHVFPDSMNHKKRETHAQAQYAPVAETCVRAHNVGMSGCLWCVIQY